MLLVAAAIIIALTSVGVKRIGATPAKTASSVTAKQAIVADANTILLLHFDNSLTGGDGELPADAAGVTFSPGILAQGVLIDSADVLNYATLGNFTATQGTIEFWIKPQWNGNDNVPRCLFSIGNDRLIDKDGANNLRFILNIDDSEGFQAYNVASWIANQWHHIAVTWTVPGQMKTYVDGIERISHASSNQDLISPVPPTLSIGHRNNVCQANAVIDEVRISDIARTASEIALSYVSALTVSSLNIDLATLQMYPNWTWTPKLTASTNIGTIELPSLAANWSSTNATIATVNGSGEIAAFSSGMAALTSTVQSAQDTIDVTVKPVLRAPEFGPVNPALASPAPNSLHIIPVVIIRYLPTADGVNLDTSYDPGFFKLDPISLIDLKSNIDTYDKRVKFMLEEGTKFRGYNNPSVQPSIGYRVVEYITVYEPTPPGKPFPNPQDHPIHLPNLLQIFQRFNLQHYINDLGVKEVWLWSGELEPNYPSYDPTIHRPENLRKNWESNMSSPTTGDISNSNRDNGDLPIYDHTYIVYGGNFRRTQAEAVHGRGHQLEAILSHACFLQDGNTDLFWKMFVGQDASGNFITGRCGWTHMPPNTTGHYDYENMSLVDSDIEDWTPLRIGMTTMVNANTWGSIPYAWPDGQLPPRRIESQWYIYWMQNMPGRGNTIPYNANRLTNWWAFTAEWDAAITAGLELYGPDCGFSISSSGQSFSANGGTGSVNVTCGSGCAWTATSNDTWITITSNPNGSGNGIVDYSVAANVTGNPRTGTMAIAGQSFTVNQTGTPTVVTLASFTADGYADGVYLQWQTGMEVETLGFHVYREQNGQRTRITPEIVAGSALIAGNKTTLTAGNAYAWWDAISKDKQDAQYWLEDIDIDGKSTLHGPITPKRIAGLPAEQSTAALLSRIGKGQPRMTQVAPNQTAPARPSQKQVETQWGFTGKSAVKLTINEEGWYRVTQGELLAAGLDQKTDPRNLQLYLQGGEQAMLVVGEQDGSFDQTDAIEFYAYGQDIPSTDAHTYWLVSGKEPGKRIVVSRSEAKRGGATTFSYTVERKERTIYFSSLKNGDEENFFGRVITPQPVDQELRLQHLDRTSQEDGVLEVALQGVTDLPTFGPDHQVKVTLNGTLVGSIIFDGRQHPVERFGVPHSLLKEGENVVTLVAEGGPSDISLVDFIRITYRHTYTADQDVLRMTVGETKLVGPIVQQSQTIDGFTNASIRVVDITNPNEPQELIGQVEERKGGGFAVTVQVVDGAPRTLMAFTDERIKRPASITIKQASNWRDKNNRADLLIITHRTFVESLAPLTAIRRRQGFAVETVDIEDVYDEFNFGEKSPQAIKDFLAFARTSWKLAPRFVLFAGDASYDPRDYLGAGDFDLVPTKRIDTTYLETASDDWFVDFNDEGLAEMYVGRLPVRTPVEATVLVSKIVNYDSVNPKMPIAKESVLLIADRNDGFDFEAASHRLSELIPSGITAQEIFRGRLDDATAKKQVIDAISAGQTIVNYTGHGSTNVWRNLLTTSDIQSLNNQQKLSLFVAMTCLNGYFHEPVIESLAEGLLKSERGGAIAMWASSGLTEPAQQALMNQQAYRLLFAVGSGLTIGEVTARAKASVSDGDIRRTWILFGDPTTRLK
jgi:hypothetical protein